MPPPVKVSLPAGEYHFITRYSHRLCEIIILSFINTVRYNEFNERMLKRRSIADWRQEEKFHNADQLIKIEAAKIADFREVFPQAN